jgi:urocanate hydratase
MSSPVRDFITHHYRHFNSAALVDAAKGYEAHLAKGGKMFVTLAGAMSTAELGLSLAEMIRQDKVHASAAPARTSRRTSSISSRTTTTSACRTTAISRPPTSRLCSSAT